MPQPLAARPYIFLTQDFAPENAFFKKFTVPKNLRLDTWLELAHHHLHRKLDHLADSLHIIDTCDMDTRQITVEGYIPYPRNISEDIHLSCSLWDEMNRKRGTLYIRSISSCHLNMISPDIKRYYYSKNGDSVM